MRISPKGQVTIPLEIRKRTGLLPHTEVDFESDEKSVRIIRIVRARKPKKPGRGGRLIAHLRGRGNVVMSTDEIMALTRGR